MPRLGSHHVYVGIVLFLLLGLSACGGAGGGPGPEGAGQGLVLLAFSEDSTDNAPLNCRLRFEFSEDVDFATVNGASLQVRQGPEFGVTATGLFIVEGSTVLFEPALPGTCDFSDSGFRPGTQYRVQLLGYPEEYCLRNTSGQPLNATQTFEFRTLDENDPGLLVDQIPGFGPVVTATYPADGSQAVPVEASNAVEIQISENLHPCTIEATNIRFLMCEIGDPGVTVDAPNGLDSGFAVGTDTSDQTPGDPYTWGASGSTSLMPDPQVLPATFDLVQTFQGTTLRIKPTFGRFPENALIVVELGFDIQDFGNQSLTPYTMSFTTENRPREEYEYLLANEGETPYDEGLTTAKVNVDGVCPSRVQGFLLFAGDGDNGPTTDTPTAPENDPPACTLPRAVNDGNLDDFAPTADVVLDTGATRNVCPNSVDGSTAVVWEFASMYIGANITVEIRGVNPAILLVRGDVTIDTGGRLLLAGGDGQDGNGGPQAATARLGGTGVAGGGDGGKSYKPKDPVKVGDHGYVGYGSPDYDAVPQGGHGAGHGNCSVNTSTYSGQPSSAAGGGGGHATNGDDGDSNTSSGTVWEGTPDGMGGLPYPDGPSAARMPTPSAGSGGGAAGWATTASSSYTYYLHSGGAGGAGGGFVDITSSGNINVFGTIDASGGQGGDGSMWYINRAMSGAGGGGSGGGIRLLTPLSINISGGTLAANGGLGGIGATSGNTSYPMNPNDGGNGSPGRIVLEDSDSVITGMGSAVVTPGEGQEGFFRGIFDASRFAGGGLRPSAVTQPFLVGAMEPEFLHPVQNYGTQTDFDVGIPVAAAGAPGDTRILIEARGYDLQRDGTPSPSPTVGWHTVGHFTTSGNESTPAWQLAQVGPAELPSDNMGFGIDALNGSEYIQVRITVFLPDGFGALTAGSFLDDWVIRFEHDQ